MGFTYRVLEGVFSSISRNMGFRCVYRDFVSFLGYFFSLFLDLGGVLWDLLDFVGLFRIFLGFFGFAT